MPIFLETLVFKETWFSAIYNGNKLEKSVTYASEAVIPAETGVVLSADPATYAFFESETTGTADAENLLRGFDEANQTTTMGNGDDENYKFYKLTTKNGQNVGFYYGAEDGAPFVMTTAHKAYLAVPRNVAASVKEFLLFNDETTGVQEPAAGQDLSSKTIFDMQGRRLGRTSALKKGVYIVSSETEQSRKIIVK